MGKYEITREKRGKQEIIDVPKGFKIYRQKADFFGPDYIEVRNELGCSKKICSQEEFDKQKVIITQNGSVVTNVNYR